MPNKYFQFKQFTIHQDHCAMKVCTDACLFGALVAEVASEAGQRPTANDQRSTTNFLDIGTGTGLLSLMLAQKHPAADIDAVEINTGSALQAKENFNSTKWRYSLNIFPSDIKNFITEKKYDLIISNPPFFEDDLLSEIEATNLAKHDAGLTLKELLEVVQRHLHTAGLFAVLLPHHRVQYFQSEALEQG